MNFGVRFRQLVTQSGIDCESGCGSIRILHVPVRIVAANAAREIADTLEEDDRLPGEEAGECVCYWEWREDKEAVGRDTLQHVDVLMLIPAAKFELMLAVYPTQRCGVIEDIFVGVTRTRDWITNSGIAVHLDEWRSGGDVEARRVLKSKA